MAIIYNGTPLTKLTYNGVNVGAVWVCDTRTTCCTKVFPETSLSYSYCEYPLPPTISLQDTCYWEYVDEGKYVINGTNTDSCICIARTEGCVSYVTSYICCFECIDQSPVDQGSVGEYCYCISTESVWSSNSGTVNTVNCFNEIVCNCNYDMYVPTYPRCIRIQSNEKTVVDGAYFGDVELTWYSETNATLPTNTRYAVACITNTTSGVTCCICCPISNSSGSVEFCFMF